MIDRLILKTWFLLLGCALTHPYPSQADTDIEPCKPTSAVGTLCRAPFEDLAPSQSNVGLRQVLDQVKELKGKSREELLKFLKKRPAPVVRGPNGRYHLLDRHHLSRTLAEMGASEFLVEIKQDWRNLTPTQFWKKMIELKWVWLKTAQGQSILPSALPTHVRLMGDDPYRSLAGAVQNANGFDKVDVYFLEFYWALFFRKTLPHADLRTEAGFQKAVQMGIQIARSSAASGMPGYRPTNLARRSSTAYSVLSVKTP